MCTLWAWKHLHPSVGENVYERRVLNAVGKLNYCRLGATILNLFHLRLIKIMASKIVNIKALLERI